MSTMVHVSFDRVTEFVPRVPQNRCSGEDGEIPRICVAPDVTNCLRSLPRGGLVLEKMKALGLPIIVHTYYLKSGSVMGNEEVRKYVPDADETKEMWIMEKPDSVYRRDYEITNFLNMACADQDGERYPLPIAVNLKRCRFQSNTENFFSAYRSGGEAEEELRELVQRISFRKLVVNLDDDVIEELKEARNAARSNLVS